MELTTAGGLPCYRFPHLAAFPELAHGVFTRQGGVSPEPYASLNLSFSVGDHPDLVGENRSRVARALGLTELVSAHQVHGVNNSVIGAGLPSPDQEIPEADILMTGEPGLGLLIKQADCQAVMLYDPGLRVAANVHCGWRGQASGILGEAVAQLTAVFGCRPEDLWAGIGPGLGPCCAQFRNFERELPRSFWDYQVRPAYFDLWRLSRDQLAAAGLKPERIHIARLCTQCRAGEFFSYRREGVTGRQGAVIALRP